MKKILIMFFTTLLVFFVVPQSVYGAESVNLTVKADKDVAKPGDTISYTVSIGEVDNLGGLDFYVILPDEGLTFVEESVVIPGGVFDTINAIEGDTIIPTKGNMRWCHTAQNAGYTGNSELVLFTFSCVVNGSAILGEKSVTLDMETCFDNSLEMNELQTSIVMAKVTVAQTPEQITEPTPEKIIHKVGVTLKDNTTNAQYKVTSKNTVEYSKPIDKTKTTVTIPSTVKIDGITYKVTSIASSAFKGNKKITKVTIGSNVKTIGKQAFSGCTKLKTVTIGKNVTTISDQAFYKCTSLTKITIPANVTKIGKQAFSGCAKLKTVTIGKNVTTIGDQAFYKCTSLTKITIPAKVTKIGKQAFYGDKKLKTITIKTTKLTTKNVGSQAFKGINTSATIKVPKNKVKTYATLFKKKGVTGKKQKIK